MELSDFAEKTLDLARRASEQAEVYIASGWEVPVSFEANKLKRLEASETRGVALRLIAGGRIGLASTTRLEEPEKLVEDALAVAQFGAEAKFELPAKIPSGGVKIYDPGLSALETEKMVELARGMIEQVLAAYPDVLCDVGLSKSEGEVTIFNSRGGRAAYRKTLLSAMLHINRIRDTDMLDIYESDASCFLDLDCKALVEKALEKIRLAERIVSPPVGQVPVIFTPKGAIGTLFESLEMALNGKLVWQGASPLKDRLGEKVFDERISIYDDGQVEGAVPSVPFDDEGIATRHNALVENGVVRAFYYDLQTAGLSGKESTGNAARSLSGHPSPGLHTVIFPPGDTPYKAMLEDIKEGLLVDQTMGGWAGNTLAGEFSANVHLGYRVERGELIGRVKDTMVAGNVFAAMKALAAVGDEAIWVGRSIQIPYLYFPSLGVAGKE
ncbi:MAG: TldD/PmbA family protein [Anaerolineae bacterium]